jgi:hypothetical protein
MLVILRRFPVNDPSLILHPRLEQDFRQWYVALVTLQPSYSGIIWFGIIGAKRNMSQNGLYRPALRVPCSSTRIGTGYNNQLNLQSRDYSCIWTILLVVFCHPILSWNKAYQMKHRCRLPCVHTCQRSPNELTISAFGDRAVASLWR